MMPSQDQSSRENLARAFGSRLQSLRTQRDLSVAEFESRYGVSGVEDLEGRQGGAATGRHRGSLEAERYRRR